MKTNQSGNGVTVANLFKVVRLIEGKNFSSDYHIKKMKSSELLKFWNYKAEGYTLQQAIEKLCQTIAMRNTISKDKAIKTGGFMYCGSSKYCRPGQYLTLQQEKRNRIKTFVDGCENLENANQYFRYKYGSYDSRFKTFIIHGTNTPYPVTATIKWSEETDWNYYAKSYGRPKNTYSNRRVEFSTIGKLGKIKTLFTYPLTTFAGAFMEKAIASYYRITKAKCDNKLKNIQLADYFSLTETNSINGYRLFKRTIGPIEWDYAILDTKTKNTYHSEKQDQLIPGLRAKLQAKFDRENETINKELGYSLGFCQTGMQQFCSDNDVDFDGDYTRQQLRNIVVANRELNFRKYRKELAKVGIQLGK